MRVVIVGAGKVGMHLSTSLASGGHHVLVLDVDRRLVAEAQRGLHHERIEYAAADGCELSSLEDHDLRSADVVVAATGDDADNLVVSALAKQEFGVHRVVARVNHPENLWLFNETWGVDVSVSMPHLLAAVVEEAVTVGQLVRLLNLGSAGATIQEVRLPATSPAVGCRLAALRLPRESTVVAIIRDERIIVPRGDTTFAADDEVVLLALGDTDEAVEEILLGTAPVRA
jgi:trk system potassium uptake protein TrkA